MILLEQEPALPAGVEVTKTQVLLCLQTMHKQQEFVTPGELGRFLDTLLDELDAVAVPRGLTRVILFWRSKAAVDVVRARMLPGHDLHAFQAPGCWLQMGRSLPDLRAWARRIDPAVMAGLPGGV